MNSTPKPKSRTETPSKPRRIVRKSQSKSPARTSTSLAESQPRTQERRSRNPKKVNPKTGIGSKRAPTQQFADPFKILSANFSYAQLQGDTAEYDNSDDERSSGKSSDEETVPVKVEKPRVKKHKKKKARAKKRPEKESSDDFLYVGGDFENASIISIKEPCEIIESEDDEGDDKKIENGVIKSTFTLKPGLTRPIVRKEGCLDISKLKVIHPISSIWKKSETIEKKKVPKKKKTKRVVKKKKAGPAGDRRDATAKKVKPPTKKLRCKKTRIVK